MFAFKESNEDIYSSNKYLVDTSYVLGIELRYWEYWKYDSCSVLREFIA
jgi:hypothetical protein